MSTFFHIKLFTMDYFVIQYFFPHKCIHIYIYTYVCVSVRVFVLMYTHIFSGLFFPFSFFLNTWDNLCKNICKGQRFSRTITSTRWCPWCNGYRRRIWTRRHEFKSSTCISHSINALGKGMKPIILPPAMGK